MEVNFSYIHNVWDLLLMQADVINKDAYHFINYQSANIHPSVVLENGDNIFIGEKTQIKAGTI